MRKRHSQHFTGEVKNDLQDGESLGESINEKTGKEIKNVKIFNSIVHYTVRERNALFWQRCNLKPEGYNAPRDKNTPTLDLYRMCTMNNCESEEIVEAANIAISNLLPTKSRSLYDIAKDH
ncbi:hypothetical protein NQ317_005565 [Molorchus minor]|uniref:Uncharacterized protein n=1 Tax=Molorchus minor TaxID=1323400 RepID=A0ABQ9J9T4_9CUCU|nr:hypothetical protein NQ317_005565 [Molorchus minor]